MKMIIIGIGILGCLATSPAFAADAPVTVTINAIQDKQPGVPFPHKTHMGILNGKCAACHSTATGGPLKPELVSVKDKGKMNNAYHKQCLECHKKTQGPVACSSCHKK